METLLDTREPTTTSEPTRTSDDLDLAKSQLPITKRSIGNILSGSMFGTSHRSAPVAYSDISKPELEKALNNPYVTKLLLYRALGERSEDVMPPILSKAENEQYLNARQFIQQLQLDSKPRDDKPTECVG